MDSSLYVLIGASFIIAALVEYVIDTVDTSANN